MNKLDLNFEKIILISLDTLRADCIPFNPDKSYLKEYKTEVKLNNSKLNEIFSKGVFFNNVISAAPYTSASHAAYFTGKWPKNNGIYDQFNSKLKTKNIFQIFKNSGYETIFKTDFPFILGKYLNLIKGVDKYFIEDDKAALKELKSDNKQLAFFHFGQIHYPYGFHNLKYGKEDYKQKIKTLEKKFRIKTKLINLDDMAIESFRTNEDLELLYRYKKIISFLYKKGLDDKLFELYLEGINYFNRNKLDNFLNELLRMMDNKKYLLIVFADHGEAWNDHTYGHHNSLDEGVIKVPLVFYTKNIKPRMFSNRVRTIDLAPTLNDLINKNKNRFDGKSLLNQIITGAREDDRDAFSSIWVNESNVVIKKIKTLLQTDKLKFNKSLSVKYASCFYKNRFKYIEYYKRFINRSEKLDSANIKDLYSFSPQIKKIKNSNLSSYGKLKKEMNKLNLIQKQSNSSSDEIRRFLRLQGYKV